VKETKVANNFPWVNSGVAFTFGVAIATSGVAVITTVSDSNH
jgi:hypothetical protein